MQGALYAVINCAKEPHKISKNTRHSGSRTLVVCYNEIINCLWAFSQYPRFCLVFVNGYMRGFLERLLRKAKTFRNRSDFALILSMDIWRNFLQGNGRAKNPILYTERMLLSSVFHKIFLAKRKKVAIIFFESNYFASEVNMGDRSKQLNPYVGQLIKSLRENRGLTQKEIAKIVHKGDSTVRMWELGKSEPDNETLRSLAKFFGVSVDYLLGLNERTTPPSLPNEVELNDLFPIPLLGKVVAGIPLESQENLEGYVYVSYRPTEEYFALRIDGDSMKNAGIFNKSVVVCHKQETAESGDIVVAMLNGEQTVKRFKQVGTSIFLMPENPDFDPIPVTARDSLIILGKVVEVRVMF